MKEYNMFKKFMPDKIAKGKEFFEEKYEQMKNEKEVKLSQSDKIIEYKEFYEKERAITDLYYFWQIFMNKFYQQYVKLNKSQIKELIERLDGYEEGKFDKSKSPLSENRSTEYSNFTDTS
jgi:radical SAM superfamily enzyme YgiQ (UPF0313 family)